jgi:hypothetical protein
MEQSPVITPDDGQLLLEQARAARAQAEADTLRLQQEIERKKAEGRQIVADQKLRDAALAGPKFYNVEDALTIARKDHDIRFDGDGEGTGVVDGRRVPLAEVFAAIALENESLVDGRSLRSLKESQPKVKPRSQMTDAEKIAFINANGLKAFEDLPLRATRTVRIETFQDYLALPMKERAKLAGLNGADWIAKLPRTK